MLKTLLLHLFCPFMCLTASPIETTAAAKTTEAPSEASVVLEQTFSIIKPDAVEQNVVGEILDHFESAGLKIVASKMTQLTTEQVKMFYAAHKDKSFFPELVEYMTSGPVILQVLEGENAIALNREVMGATDPAKALPGTIRFDFGTNITRNAVHGSDAKESANKEIALFFTPTEIYSQQ